MSNAKVANVLEDGLRLVINKGSKDNIYMGQIYLVFELGEELFDPETGDSLGQLEIVKGKGKVIHIQEKMSTIESIEKEKITHRSSQTFFARAMNPYGGNSDSSTEEILKPFSNPKIGDDLKLVR